MDFFEVLIFSLLSMFWMSVLTVINNRLFTKRIDRLADRIETRIRSHPQSAGLLKKIQVFIEDTVKDFKRIFMGGGE